MQDIYSIELTYLKCGIIFPLNISFILPYQIQPAAAAPRKNHNITTKANLEREVSEAWKSVAISLDGTSKISSQKQMRSCPDIAPHLRVYGSRASAWYLGLGTCLVLLVVMGRNAIRKNTVGLGLFSLTNED